MSDPIRDVAERIRQAMTELGLLTAEVEAVIDGAEADTRNDWAGDRPYIAKVGERVRRMISERNRAILRDWRNGERVSLIARKYGISPSRVCNVIRAATFRDLP